MTAATMHSTQWYLPSGNDTGVGNTVIRTAFVNVYI